MYSFSASAQQALNIGSQSSGAGAGKITFSPATMTIPIGPGSMALLDAFNAGDHFTTATVMLNTSSGTPAETITLTLVAVSAVTTESDGSSTTPPQVQVSLEYGGSQYALATN
jgi:type VI protein secretion system component Hcp